MKRQGHLFEKIREIDNIKRAIIKGSKHKRDRKQVQKCLDNLDDCALRIQKLIDDGYIPKKGRKLFINSGPKPRTVYVPSFYPDHIIEWAVLLQIQPLLSRGMYSHSFASIPGRGMGCAKKYIEKCLRNKKKTKYCLKADVRHFYGSINHRHLKAALSRIIKDPVLLSWFDKLFENYESGLPIGHILSQWFANFFLQNMDHYIKENLHAGGYGRYMDDIVIFGPNKRKLHAIRKLISEFLEKIGLVLKKNWQVFCVDERGLDFVGYRFYHYKTILRRSTMLRFSRKVRRVYKTKRYNRYNAASIISRLGRLKKTNCYGWYRVWISPYINVKKLKRVISNGNHKRNAARNWVYNFKELCPV